MSYSSLIQRLYKTNVFSPVKLGLENMQRLNALLNYPINSVPIIHITGTNGKGSVSLKLARCLRESGVKTGIFTSPHISSFKERIMVNDELLNEADVESIFPEIFEHCKEHTIPATFFELTTALALVKFHRAECEAVVLEVGLGGRLDATNIVTPTLSIITAIQMDHTKVLGDTIEKIALEKAGIMKPGVNVLVGPGCPIDIMRAEASRIGAILYTLDDLLVPAERRYQWDSSAVDDHSNDLTSVGEDIDDLNYDIAHAALKLLKRQHMDANSGALYKLNGDGLNFESALKTRPPCRFEIFKQQITTISPSNQVPVKRNVDVVLDIAHNVDALRSLARKVKLLYNDVPIRVVLGMSSDKDIAKCVPHVLSLVDNKCEKIHCTAAKHPRAINIQDLRSIILNASAASSRNRGQCNSSGIDTDEVVETAVVIGEENDNSCVFSAVREAVVKAVQDSLSINNNNIATSSDKADAVVIVCGTAFIMSDARAELGVKEPRDSEDLFFSPTQLTSSAVSIAK